jgi:hypothetical protein
VRIEQEEDKKPVVRLQEDERKPGDALSVDDACKRIVKLESWGSGVYLSIVSPKRLPAGDLKKLLEAIEANVELELVHVSIGRGEGFMHNFLKTMKVEP